LLAAQKRRKRWANVNMTNGSLYDLRAINRRAKTHHPSDAARVVLRAMIEEAIGS